MAAGSAVGRPLNIGVQFHKSGLLFTSKQSLNAWEQVGSKLFSFADSSTWWIADWLVYGESQFHDRYYEAIKQTSLSYQTLRNYTWVARNFPMPRRRHNLSFSHHLEVVSLDQPEQDYWLRKAEEFGWSRNKLRGELRSSLRTRQVEAAPSETESHDSAPASVDADAAPVATGPSPEAHLLLELPAEVLATIRTAANRRGAPVEIWAAEILRRAAVSP
ncbi:LmbU family transcriptional regulator [Streptomyces griseus]|uniref:LmbU family transcriptional regulator n=1 Tax=Streptomyces griseus TaxID=1911 RepID=UPI0034026EB3